jgi:hypothetical protein
MLQCMWRPAESRPLCWWPLAVMRADEDDAVRLQARTTREARGRQDYRSRAATQRRDALSNRGAARSQRLGAFLGSSSGAR